MARVSMRWKEDQVVPLGNTVLQFDGTPVGNTNSGLGCQIRAI